MISELNCFLFKILHVESTNKRHPVYCGISDSGSLQSIYLFPIVIYVVSETDIQF